MDISHIKGNRKPTVRAYTEYVKPSRLTFVAFLLTVTGALVAAFAPIGGRVESLVSDSGATVSRSYLVSLFHVDGAWVLVVVSVPILLALVPVLWRHRTVWIVSAVLLWIGCVLGMLSVGWFFVPAAIAMTIAAVRREPAPAPPLPPIRAFL
jgi:hypothetical protein